MLSVQPLYASSGRAMLIPSDVLQTSMASLPALASSLAPTAYRREPLVPLSSPLVSWAPYAGYTRSPTISQSTAISTHHASAPAGTPLATCPQKLKPSPGSPLPVPPYLAKLAVASFFREPFAQGPVIGQNVCPPSGLGAPQGLQLGLWPAATAA